MEVLPRGPRRCGTVHIVVGVPGHACVRACSILRCDVVTLCSLSVGCLIVLQVFLMWEVGAGHELESGWFQVKFWCLLFLFCWAPILGTVGGCFVLCLSCHE